MPVKASFSPPVSLINKFTFALRSFTVACRWQRVALGVNYGWACLAFTALILIFMKATCDNMADAGWGFKSPPLPDRWLWEQREAPVHTLK